MPFEAAGVTSKLTGTRSPWVKLVAVLGVVTVGAGRLAALMVKGSSESSEESQLPVPSTYQTRAR